MLNVFFKNNPFQEYKEMTESTNQKNFDAIYENFLFNVKQVSQ